MSNLTTSHRLLGSVVLASGLWLTPSTSQAGIPECGGVRLEDVTRCEIKGDVQCTGGCSDLGIYKKACATKLHTRCRETCTVKAEPTCTDECTVACDQDCQMGVNVICIHNCFGECVGSCDASCAGAADAEQCRASCEATCDGECDIQCAPVVNASCYQHCVECCGGACGAQANMDCQTTCQDEQFESCEYELKVDCEASCSGSGALFCDNEYVLSGEQLGTCVNALIARGIASAELQAQVNGQIETEANVNAGCQMSRASQNGMAAGLFAAAWALVAYRRRRRGRTSA